MKKRREKKPEPIEKALKELCRNTGCYDKEKDHYDYPTALRRALVARKELLDLNARIWAMKQEGVEELTRCPKCGWLGGKNDG